MKLAIELVENIALAVSPPRGATIVLRECPGRKPNWTLAAGEKEEAWIETCTEKLIELQKSYPMIDWSSVQSTGDGPRAVKWPLR